MPAWTRPQRCRKWPKLGHLLHPLAQKMIFEPKFLKWYWFPVKKRRKYIWCQSQPPRTTPAWEMANTLPSEAFTGQETIFEPIFIIRYWFPVKNKWFDASLNHLGPHRGQKWPKLGHLEHPLAQEITWYKILKKELTLGEKQIIWCQSQPPWTTLVP